MVQAILPQSSSTSWEQAVAIAGDYDPLVSNAIAALKTFKYTPPSSLLDFLIYERGLADLTPYVTNKYELWTEGGEFLAKRGTEAALQIGLGWLQTPGQLEEEHHERSFWNLFQVALDQVFVDPALLEKIEGVTKIAAPLRSKFWRGYHGFDVRPLTFGESHWGEAHWGAYSGARLRPDGALWSFGRTYEFALVPSEAELTALGIWVDPGGGGAALSWGDFSWSEANASWVDDGEEVRGRLMANALFERVTHVAFKDALGDVIGFRRLKYKHFVSPNLNGEYEFAGVKYAHSTDPTRRLLVEAFTDFGDGVGQTATDIALVLDGQLQAGVPIGTAFATPSEMQNHLTPFADQANQIEFAPTVRERVRFLLTL
jgi:hypothetical protein